MNLVYELICLKCKFVNLFAFFVKRGACLKGSISLFFMLYHCRKLSSQIISFLFRDSRLSRIIYNRFSYGFLSNVFQWGEIKPWVNQWSLIDQSYWFVGVWIKFPPPFRLVVFKNLWFYLKVKLASFDL